MRSKKYAATVYFFERTVHVQRSACDTYLYPGVSAPSSVGFLPCDLGAGFLNLVSLSPVLGFLCFGWFVGVACGLGVERSFRKSELDSGVAVLHRSSDILASW